MTRPDTHPRLCTMAAGWRVTALATLWACSLSAAHAGILYDEPPPPDNLVAAVRIDDATLFKILKPLAEQGNAEAQRKLGEMYFDGHGTDRDPAQSVSWLEKAGEQGDAQAQYLLGQFHAYGLAGIEADNAKAAHWYYMAAQQGHLEAQFRAGELYAAGKGVQRDGNLAVSLFRMAAEQGSPAAQLKLAVMYTEGHGVLQDYRQAMDWCRKAASGGYAPAQVYLGTMYYAGQGSPPDYTKAYRWLSIAMGNTQGNTREGIASFRDSVAKRMTPAQLAAARRPLRDAPPPRRPRRR